MQPKQLSKADSKVLAQVFDPESAPCQVEVVLDPKLPADRHIYGKELQDRLRAREMVAIAIIEHFEDSRETASNRHATYQSALQILDTLITEHPDYASARNNRAQLRRWRFGDRNTLSQSKSCANAERSTAGLAVVRDLKTSIELASPERPQDPISPTQGHLLAQSYTQLAAVYYAAFKDMDTPSIIEVANLDGTSWPRERFEEEASRCFYLGGLYGNQVAKALAVHANPHAKLCGAIVKEALRKEIASV